MIINNHCDLCAGCYKHIVSVVRVRTLQEVLDDLVFILIYKESMNRKTFDNELESYIKNIKNKIGDIDGLLL